MMKIYTLFFVLISPVIVTSYNILGVFPTVGKSHYMVGESLMKALWNAGHNISMLSPFQQKKQLGNWTDIQLTGLLDVAEKEMSGMSAMNDLRISAVFMLPFLFRASGQLYEFTFNHPNVKNMMKTEKYDLIIIEMFCTESFLGFGEYFKVPVVAVSTFGSSKWTNDLVGSPAPLSYVPHPFLNLDDKLTFFDRILNTLMTTYEITLMHLLHYPTQIKSYNNAFPNAKLSLYEAIKNVSLVLLNTHVSLGTPRPYVPNMIEIGGIHLNRNVNSLPKDIQDFIDSAADDGIIYFSMGSFIKSSDFSLKNREVFFQAFSKIKQKIIWKFEDETIKMPDNVFVKNWLPQIDILANPNVKAFISHGGLLGITEAIYHGVPLIGIPIFGDQLLNVERAQNVGYGIKLDFSNITEESVSWCLNEIINNPKYIRSAKKISAIYRDQPMSPTEKAIYWIEYVIRHQGASHLRSAGLELSFMQYHCIDVWLTLTFCSLIFLWTFIKMVKCCCQKFCSPSKSNHKNIKHKKRN